MSETIESRLAKVERELAILKTKVPHDKSNWITDITGEVVHRLSAPLPWGAMPVL